MTRHDLNSTFDESDFPDLDISDHIHLQQQFNLHGRERVAGWLRTKVGLPLRLQLADDADEDAYYEALADYYVDTGRDQTE